MGTVPDFDAALIRNGVYLTKKEPRSAPTKEENAERGKRGASPLTRQSEAPSYCRVLQKSEEPRARSTTRRTAALKSSPALTVAVPIGFPVSRSRTVSVPLGSTKATASTSVPPGFRSFGASICTLPKIGGEVIGSGSGSDSFGRTGA